MNNEGSSTDDAIKLCDGIERIGDHYFVFHLKDVVVLRTMHRIIGRLIGTLPLNIHQNHLCGLPLILNSEEAHFLHKRSILKFKAQKTSLPYNEQLLRLLTNQRDHSVMEQSKYCHSDLIESRLAQLKSILDCRKSKRLKTSINETETKNLENNSVESSNDTRLEMEEEKQRIISTPISMLDTRQILVEIPMTSYFDESDSFEPITLDFSLLQSLDKLKCAVFEDLHEKGFYLSSALKFGGHFLVYAGDPLRFHACYIALAVLEPHRMTRLEKLAYCRLGCRVKKTFLLCYWQDERQQNIVYEKLRWHKSCLAD